MARKVMTRFRYYIRHILAVAFLVVILVIPSVVSAVPGAYGNGAYGTCTYNTCGITLTSSGAVSLNIIPGASTTCTTQSDSVAVTTDSSTGYSLSMQNTATTSSLLGSGTNTIPTSSGSQASPLALTANIWGYRVDSVGGFGAGPTSANNNVATSAITFAAIPTSAQSADNLAATSVAANPTVTTPVWYGVCSDTTIPADTYSSIVTYTAVVN